MNALEKLKSQAAARIEELRGEIDTLEQFVKSAEAASAILSAGAASETARPPPAATPSPRPQKPPAKSRGKPRPGINPPSAKVIDVAVRVLRENGQPMGRRQLHHGLAAQGIDIKGTDPLKALGTILWRASDRIDSYEGRGYWPKGDALPASNEDSALQVLSERS